MSYFNQPDHELLDRRDEDAKTILLRLARASTTVEDAQAGVVNSAGDAKALSPGAVASAAESSDVRGSAADAEGASASSALERWQAHPQARALPLPDPSPFIDGEIELPLIWRDCYVAVVFEDTPSSAARKLEDRGLEILVFGASEESWPQSFDRLAKALGRGR